MASMRVTINPNYLGLCSRCDEDMFTTYTDPAKQPVELRVKIENPRPQSDIEIELGIPQITGFRSYIHRRCIRSGDDWSEI